MAIHEYPTVLFMHIQHNVIHAYSTGIGGHDLTDIRPLVEGQE